jgi:tetratricopeptide (TPR) repeat protein
MRTATKWCVPILSMALPLAAAGHDGHEHHAAMSTGMRGAHLDTGCIETSQQRFDRGFYLLHNMDYTRARAAFETAASADPACAMLSWGAAMTYFQPLWPGKPNDAALARGAQAAAAARAAARTEADRGYAAAVSAFYAGDGIDYGLRLQHWAAAQKRLAEQRPDDIEAQAFHQLSRLAARDRKDKTYAESIAAGHDIERLLQQRPDHPGLMHYLVHAYDNPGLALNGVDVSKQYMATSPDTAHALHMPSHIYTRLGDWPRMIDANQRSAAAALDHPTADGRVSRDFLHAADYLVYGQLQTGDDRAAAATAARIDPATPYEENFGAGAYALAAVPARLALERRDFAGAAALVPRATPYDWEQFPWAEAVTHAARGLGAARSGDAETAKAELAELERLQSRIDAPWWAERVGIERDVIAAWLAWNDHDAARAETRMRAAATRETAAGKDSVEPGHVVVASEEWGELLLALGRASEAQAAFETSLRESPNRFNALYGAARSAERAGQHEQAAAYYRQLLEIASESSPRPELENARRFLAGRN